MKYCFKFQEKKEEIKVISWPGIHTAGKVVHNFKEQMPKYFHSEVGIMRVREICMKLEDVNGKHALDQDSVRYKTIKNLKYDVQNKEKNE